MRVPNLCAAGGYVCSMASPETPGGRNVALESLSTDSTRETGLPSAKVEEGLRGGSGGRGFGGDSRLISGLDALRALKWTLLGSRAFGNGALLLLAA